MLIYLLETNYHQLKFVKEIVVEVPDIPITTIATTATSTTTPPVTLDVEPRGTQQPLS